MSMHYEGPIYDIKQPILGIAGRKQHGKDAIAGMLQSRLRWGRCAFADWVKDVAMDLWDLSDLQVNGTQEEKEAVDPRWGVSPRHLLQVLGTEGARHAHPETWIRYLLRRMVVWEEGSRSMGATPAAGWVIADVRFPNEADAVRKHGGRVWKVVRPEYMHRASDTHASETSVDLIVPDVTIVNDGTLADLWDKVVAHV